MKPVLGVLFVVVVVVVRSRMTRKVDHLDYSQAFEVSDEERSNEERISLGGKQAFLTQEKRDALGVIYRLCKSIKDESQTNYQESEINSKREKRGKLRN